MLAAQPTSADAFWGFVGGSFFGKEAPRSNVQGEMSSELISAVAPMKASELIAAKA